MSGSMLAGVDIGGTKTAVVLSSCLPKTTARQSFQTAPELGPERAVERIIESLRQALASQSLEVNSLAAIGVSCGGPLDTARGLIQAPPNLSTWHDVPICKLLEQEFCVPCLLENDANAGALAEARFGAGRGSVNMIFMTMGTGLGAGLILNGSLYRGVSNSAGEIGHVRLSRRGPMGYGKAGSVEGWASGGGMGQIARIYARGAARKGESTLLLSADGKVPQSITGVQVAAAATQGDRIAKAVVQTVAEHLGETMAILIDVLNPERIIVGGLALRFGESLLGPAREVVRREALGPSAQNCQIVKAELGERIGDLAALCIADSYISAIASSRAWSLSR